MAMSMDQGFALELWWMVVGLLDQEFAEQESLLAKPFSILIVRHQVCHFIAEHRDATWLQAYDRQACGDVRPQRFEHLVKQFFGGIQHAKVVERASTTENIFGNDHLIPSMFQHFNRSLGDVGTKVIIEGVGPKHDLRTVLIADATPAKPCPESFVGKPGNLARLSDASQKLELMRNTGSLCGKVHNARGQCSQARPPMDPTHGIR